MNPVMKAGALFLMCGACSAAPLYISHRGESLDAPENTMSAFRLAWQRQTDGIECDIHLTGDNRLVVIHDDVTGRVADKNCKVEESTFDDLRKLDFGVKKDAKFTGEKIPALSELLAELPKDGRIYIELKGDNPELVAALHGLLQNTRLTPEQVILISFSDKLLEQAKRLMPQYKAYYLSSYSIDSKTGKTNRTAEDLIETARRIKADGLDLSFGAAWSAELVKQFHDAGLEVHCWTVDNLEAARQAAAFGVDSITSNRARHLMDNVKK